MTGEIMTTEHIRFCPSCGGTEFVKDYKREETYCNNCGLVLQSAVQYVGLEKVENVIPYSASANARQGIHMKYTHRDDMGKNPNKITSYRHNIPNWKLMKYGRR